MSARRSQRDTDPRVIGGRYRSGYWGTKYTVDAIEFDTHGWLSFITVSDDAGTRTHCTAWDTHRDTIIDDNGLDASGTMLRDYGPAIDR